MAGMSTAIQVKDDLSPAMGVMAASVEHMRITFLAFQVTAERYVEMSGVNAAAGAMNEMESAAAEVNVETKNAAEGQEEFSNEVRAGSGFVDGLLGKMKSLAGSIFSMERVKDALSMSDEIAGTMAGFQAINDGQQTTRELFQAVAASASNARTDMGSMASAVTDFGRNAKDAFSSTGEMVDFANLMSKSMEIAGMSTEDSAASMSQLSQALAMGALGGDELNSIFEQAPNLIGYLSEYMDMPIEKIREMASQGEISAETLKAAVFAASGEINGEFEQLPTTFGQITAMMGNDFAVAFASAFEKLSEFASSEEMQTVMEGAKDVLEGLGAAASEVVDIMANVVGVITENWGFFGPLVLGVAFALGIYAAATGIAAIGQAILNGALLACPLTWILLMGFAFIAIIYAIVAAVNNATGSTYSAVGVICGIIAVAGAFIANIVLGVINFVIGIFIELWNFFNIFVAAFSIIFNNPIAAIQVLFLNLFNFIVGVVEAAAGLIDTIFGSNLASAVAGFQAKVQAKIDTLITENGGSKPATINSEDYKLKPISYSGAWDAGYNWGANFGSGDSGAGNIPESVDVSGNTSNIPSNMGAIADNTGATAGNTGRTADNTAAIANSVDISNEQLKYLRDIAERDTVNRFTTASIKVTMNNNNTVNSEMDLDGIVNNLAYSVENAMVMAAEGVHK